MSEGRKDSGNKGLVILFLVLCFVICGLITGIIVVINNNRLVLNTPEEASAYLANFGNADDIKPYVEAADRALEGATNNDVKAKIYSMRAGVIFNYNGIDKESYYEQMLSDAYNAEEIKHSADTAYMIYICEEKVGNDEKSKEYYEVAKERGYFDVQVNG